MQRFSESETVVQPKGFIFWCNTFWQSYDQFWTNEFS